MKFLCDVHIPKKLSKHLETLGFPSEHVNHVLDGCFTKDVDISAYVDANELILITKDRDFKNSHLLVGSPRKLIKVNLGNSGNDQLIEIFEVYIRSIEKVQKEFEMFLIELNQDGLLTVST